MPKILAFKEGKLYYTYLEEDHYIWIFQRVRFPKLITVLKVCHGFERFLVGLQIPEFLSRLQQQPCNYIWVTGVTMIKDQKTQKHKHICSFINNILMLEICRMLKSHNVSLNIRNTRKLYIYKRCSVVCQIAISLSSLV